MVKKKSDVKKIVFITSSLTAGGAQENIINISRHLSKKNYEIDIISLRSVNDYINKKSEKYRIISLINADNAFPAFAIPFIAIIVVFKLCILLKKKNYVLLIGSHEYYPFYLSVFFSKVFKVKSLLLLGNNLREEFRYKGLLFSWIHGVLIKFSFQHADKLICVSKGLAADIKAGYNLPARKIEAIYNGIDIKEIKRFGREKASLGYGKNTKIISILGKLIEKKGHMHLIRAFALIKRSYPKLKLLIIGKGRSEMTLKKLVRDVGLENDILFLGMKENPYKYLSLSSLFVFPSLYEGFGNVILEAMACGLPIVSTNVPYGPREILDDKLYHVDDQKIIYGKYGILIAAPKVRGTSNQVALQEKLLAQVVIKLLKDTKRLAHYRKMSIKRVENFTSDKMAELHNRVITKMITQ